MSKKLLIPLLLVLVWNVGKAQRFDGGVFAGLNASQVDGDSYQGFNKPGLVAGVYVETDVAPAVFMAMEIKYAEKGSRKKVTMKDPNKYLMRLAYIDVPVYLGFRTNERGAVVAGLSAGYLMDSKESNNYGELPPEDRHAFNTLDLQGFVGFQFELTDEIKADLRFAYSIIPIRGEPGDNPDNYYWDRNQFNNVISLAAYYQIGKR